MMQFLRKYMKWIFTFVAVCFLATIFFVWGMGKTAFRDSNLGAFAVVNGYEITEYAFEAEWRKTKEAQSIDENMPEFQVIMYKKQILNNMITERLITDYLTKSKIRFNKEDEGMLKSYIRLVAQYEFKRDYKSLDDMSFNLIKQRAVQILLQEKLGKSLVEQARVSENEVKEEYFRANEKRKFKYAKFTADKFLSRVSVKPEEVAKYYSEKKNNFMLPPRYKIQYIAEAISAEKADIFYKAALENSDLTAPAKLSGYKVKETEYTEQELVPGVDFDTSEDIKTAVKGLSSGEISKPVKTKKGFLVVKYNSSIPPAYLPLETVGPVVESLLKKEKALPYAEIEAEKVFKLIKEGKKSFEEAVKGFTVSETESVKLEDTIKGIENSAQFSMAGFGLSNLGDTSKLVKAGNAYYILKLVDLKKPAPELFDKEKDKLREKLVSNKQKILQYEFIAALRKSAKITDNSEKVFTITDSAAQN
ncbi:MAG: peptidyl-prolyl cis-trans isomerase [Candidatus Firestonebacteria bacterium]